MQAGRWFGFRPGYQDLVRLYIRRDSNVDLYEAFEALLMDEEAFRAELSQYAGFDEDDMPLLEPRQIPPLVSQHLPWLKPTARNKMWNAVIANNHAPVSDALASKYARATWWNAGRLDFSSHTMIGVAIQKRWVAMLKD